MDKTKFLKLSGFSSEKKTDTVTGTMLDVIIALIPAAFAGVSVFGIRAAAVIAICVISCVLSEYLWCLLMKRPSSTGDLSAVVTGILLAFSLPVSVPLWICPIGSVIAVILVKQLFGGTGKNFLNPAITARIILLLIFAGALSGFTAPSRNAVDAISAATPLAHLNAIDLSGNINGQMGELISDGKIPNIINMLFGVRAGCIGETCSPALILGAVYLALRGIISLTLPCAYIAAAALFMLVASGFNMLFTAYEILGGGLLLGAFFMATDHSSTPKKLVWKLILGAGAGILTAAIRLFTPLPEAVSYSILLINIACIFIEKKSVKIYLKPEEISPDLAGDDAHGVPSDSTVPAVENSEQCEANSDFGIRNSEECLANSDFGIRNSEIPETENTEEENAASLVGDDAHGVPPEEASEPQENEPDTAEISETTEKTPEKNPVLVNKLSPDSGSAQEYTEKKKKKGRKKKKKAQAMPDFSEPLPDVIPEFLKKELEKNKQADN